MTKKDNGVPSDKGQTQEPSSDGTGSGSGDGKTSEAHSQVPENLEGKTAKELVQIYQNLEKKLGEQSSELGSLRQQTKEAEKIKKEAEVLVGAIYADPKRASEVQKWVNQYLGVDTGQEKTGTDDSANEAGRSTQEGNKSRTDDTRRSLQNDKLVSFQKRYGLDQLSEEKRKEEMGKVASAFQSLRDPSGTKSIVSLLDETPLDRLDTYLDSAYVVANRDKLLEQGRKQGFIAAEENRQASIGSLTSSGSREEKITLTPEQHKVAEKLGVSPEKYAKQLERITKGE